MIDMKNSNIFEDKPKLSIYIIALTLSLLEAFNTPSITMAVMILLNLLALTSFFYFHTLYANIISLVMTGLAFQFTFISLILGGSQQYLLSNALCIIHFIIFCILTLGHLICLGITTYILVGEKKSDEVMN